ncbi:MAG: DUF2948 family protein [Oceanicaulis sp.]
MAQAKPLRLLAQDPDDVPPISAAMQDAVGKIGDFEYEPGKRRFTLALNRYRWEDGAKGKGWRVRSALQAGSVTAAKARRLRQGADDAVVCLLSIGFEPGETAPSGALVLTFAGGGELRLEVECVDLVLADVSEPWRAARRPEHPEDGDDPPAHRHENASGRADP